MATQPEILRGTLADLLSQHFKAVSVEILDLRLLTGGASRQTWSFDASVRHQDGRSETIPLILRMDPRRGPNFMSRETEYRLLAAAFAEGVPVPEVITMGDESLGAPGFIMRRVEGETIARRLLRDDEYAKARELMTSQLGAILARIHAIPLEKHGLAAPTPPGQVGNLTPRKGGTPATLAPRQGGPLATPEPGESPADTELGRFEATYRAVTPEPHPAFELAFRWLRRNLPAAAEVTLVHGDYRIGNVIFGPEGVRAILDWELAHIGDPMEDLGWLCVRSWRFGNDRLPVGGIGRREELWSVYEKAGGRPVDRASAHWWEVFGNLRWGIICISQARTFLEPATRRTLSPGTALELATIGRRAAETEWELLDLMGGKKNGGRMKKEEGRRGRR